MENKQTKKATLCWRCRHAVPSASTGCSWSRHFVPVEGWTATKHQQKQSGSVYETYCVISCPLFQKGGRNSADSCKDDAGCIRIAEHGVPTIWHSSGQSSMTCSRRTMRH